MKIKTELLKELLAKAIKGASNNKMIPITSLIGISVAANTIKLTTTDGSNILEVKSQIDYDVLSNPPFYTVVNADTFAKLVGKTTKEYIELENESNCLVVKGNGTYKLEIPINEDGEIIKFPAYDKLSEVEAITLSIESLKNTIQSAKSSKAQTMEIPMLTGYYLGQTSIATDRQMVCYIENNLLNESILISSEMAELINLLEGDNVSLTIKNTIKNNELIKELLFVTNNITIYGKQLEGVDDYPIEPLKNLVNINYESFVKVDKNELLNVLDRMSLFVTDYDKNGVFLNFKKEGLEVTSQKSNATEIIEIKNTIETEFTCLVDIEMLKAQLQSLKTDIAEIYYGQKTSIQLKEGNTTLILSLLDMTN